MDTETEEKKQNESRADQVPGALPESVVERLYFKRVAGGRGFVYQPQEGSKRPGEKHAKLFHKIKKKSALH